MQRNPATTTDQAALGRGGFIRAALARQERRRNDAMQKTDVAGVGRSIGKLRFDLAAEIDAVITTCRRCWRRSGQGLSD